MRKWVHLMFVPVFLFLFAVSQPSCQKTSKEIVFGATFSLTGDNASYGEDAQRGINLAVDEINQQGGVQGYKIKVIFRDNRTNPSIAVNIMRQFANVEKVPVVLGSDASSVTLAMAPVANATKTVLISPISSSPDITHAGPYVFRTAPSDVEQAKVAAEWMWNLGYRKVAVLYVLNSWGKGLADAFQERFEALGGVVTAKEGVEEQETNYRTVLLKLNKENPDAFYMPTYSKQGARIVQQYREMGLKKPILGGDTWGAPEFKNVGNELIEGIRFVAPGLYKGPEYQAFEKKFVERYGVNPDFNAASAYDALYAVAKALDKVLSKNLPPTGENIRKELLTVTFVGATGPIQFDENGDVVGKPFQRLIYRDGKAVPAEGVES